MFVLLITLVDLQYSLCFLMNLYFDYVAVEYKAYKLEIRPYYRKRDWLKLLTVGMQ